ncbi:MAG: type II toxin-antitoxin system VapC family toxin [Deltaproteobacteria bacterium]|nr:type II toxin-antitoxin system VapC family toxin [Deltaproteobacteria bacterium]
MDRIFIDTGPLFEFGTAQDRPLYERTRALLQSSAHHCYSSTYVFDELITLLLQRVPKPRVVAFGEKLRASTRLTWLHPSGEDEDAAWEVFRSYTDKSWSFTDCMSYHLIKKYQMHAALAFDIHFAQMGIPLL